MADLKSYVKVANEINLSKLNDEVIASNLIQGFSGLDYSSGILVVKGDAIVSEPQLDSLIDNHEVESLVELKAKRVAEIDNKTMLLIGNGFVFDSHNFSLSLAAQSNWTNIKANKADFAALGAFPLEITSKQGAYFLAEANVFNFWATAMGTVKSLYGSGLTLKNAINTCLTKETVNAIIDNR